MHRPRLTLLLAFGLLVLSQPADACGPYPFDTRFWLDSRPGVAQHRAVRGELGVFEPQMDPVWIYVAWRQLAGPGMVEADREKLVWLLAADDEPSADAVDAWRQARREVTGEESEWIDPARTVVRGDGDSRVWTSFDNCLAGSFTTAAATLRVRAEDHGADDPWVREWLRGQDAVFANCSDGEVTPASPAPDWPQWLRWDRQYQIAAAAFYSLRYDEAARRFGDIADERESPWSAVSGYLVGRALARAGHFDDAIARYRRVLGDLAAAEFHASARGLIDHLRYRHDPATLRGEIVARLSAKPLPESVAQDLVDFHRLAAAQAFEPGDLDPLTDWYRVVRGWTAPADVVERWRRERGGPAGPAWRWAALLRANATEVVFDDGREYSALPAAAIQELLAAGTYEPGVIGAVSEAYHRARLLLDTGRAVEAVPILERAIQGEYGSVATADTNRFLVQRLRAAESVAEVVRYGQMYPEEVGWNYDDTWPLAPHDGDLPTWAGGPLWHYAAAQALNGLAPEQLAAAVAPVAVEDQLLRRETLRVAWTRAVVLGDAKLPDLSRQLADDPVLGAQLESVVSATAIERGFVAGLIVLRNPGLHPDVHWGVGRTEDLGELDSHRNNWWCPGGSFLLPESEESPLADLASAPVWLGRVVGDYADAHPDDPRVPEALHLVVRATRHGCEWGETSFGDTSKAAFERLHQRYPKSPWAEKTPYWFD